MTLHKTTAGNYKCWYKGFYIFIFKRPHGGWAAFMEYRGIPITFNGFHTTSMPTLRDVKRWIIYG